MSKQKPPFRSGASDMRGDSSFNGADRQEEAPDSMPASPACPFCEQDETELMNAFGAHASVSTYWCRRCRAPFELMRWRGAAR